MVKVLAKVRAMLAEIRALIQRHLPHRCRYCRRRLWSVWRDEKGWVCEDREPCVEAEVEMMRRSY